MADRYARARPGYPREAVEWVLEDAHGRQVVDLAAGTGKLTAALVDVGAAVVAVEPLDEMRAALRASVPGVEALAGTAERIPLPDGSADAIVVGQAFHWFDPAVALAEIARVLRPGGRLGLLWTLRDGTVPWITELDRILDWPADVVGRAGELGRAEVAGHPRFDGAEERTFPNPEPFTAGRLVDWAASTSGVATRPAAEREALLEAVAELPARHPDLRGRATFPMPYSVVAIRSRRR